MEETTKNGSGMSGVAGRTAESSSNTNATGSAEMGNQTREVKGILKIVCRKCNTELNLRARDLNRKEETWGTDPMTFSYQCTNCRRVFYIGYNKIPEDVLFDFYNNN